MLSVHVTFKPEGPCAQHGFSLMELAVVLMIIGTLMGGVLVAIGNSFESGRRTSALNQMRQVEEALYGFAQINGRLPCPTTATAAPPGVELRDPTDGACTAWRGFVPAATLGLFGSINGDGLLVDPWQNPYRYAVAQYSLGGSYVFTHQDTLRSFHLAGNAITNDDGDASDPLGATGNMLTVVCDALKCGADTTVSDTVPAVIFSMGSNWATFNATTSSAEEVENTEDDTGTYPLPTNNVFVDSIYLEDAYDDQLLWLSPYVLFNRMVSAGRLP